MEKVDNPDEESVMPPHLPMEAEVALEHPLKPTPVILEVAPLIPNGWNGKAGQLALKLAAKVSETEAEDVLLVKMEVKQLAQEDLQKTMKSQFVSKKDHAQLMDPGPSGQLGPYVVLPVEKVLDSEKEPAATHIPNLEENLVLDLDLTEPYVSKEPAPSMENGAVGMHGANAALPVVVMDPDPELENVLNLNTAEDHALESVLKLTLVDHPLALFLENSQIGVFGLIALQPAEMETNLENEHVFLPNLVDILAMDLPLNPRHALSNSVLWMVNGANGINGPLVH